MCFLTPQCPGKGVKTKTTEGGGRPIEGWEMARNREERSVNVFKEAGEVPKETFRAAGVKGSADEPRIKAGTDQVLSGQPQTSFPKRTKGK